MRLSLIWAARFGLDLKPVKCWDLRYEFSWKMVIGSSLVSSSTYLTTCEIFLHIEGLTMFVTFKQALQLKSSIET